MEVLDTKILTIQDLHNSMEGATTTSMKDFLIYGSLQWDNAMVGQPYRANAAAFIFCTQGSATISAGLREFSMHKNTVMLYGPGNIINVVDKSNDFTVRVMLFSREFTHGALLDINAVIPVFRYLMEETNDLLELNDTEASAIDDFFALALNLAEVDNNAMTVHLLSAMFLTVSNM